MNSNHQTSGQGAGSPLVVESWDSITDPASSQEPVPGPVSLQVLDYLYTMDVANTQVQGRMGGNVLVRNARIFFVARSDGVQAAGTVPFPPYDTRLADGSALRRVYLCRLGDSLAKKLNMSNGGNNDIAATWDVMSNFIQGFEVFERPRINANTRATDIYVCGHPKGGFFRTAEEFAEHLAWLARGNAAQSCACPLCAVEINTATRLLAGPGGQPTPMISASAAAAQRRVGNQRTTLC